MYIRGLSINWNAVSADRLQNTEMFIRDRKRFLNRLLEDEG